ncbi:MAG: VCBS repeat-containing protein [Bryobacteraceae bacterium]
MAAADFNGDGKLDLAVSESIVAGNILQSNIVVMLGNGDGTFTRGFVTPGSKVLAADLNRDGKADLYVYGSADQTTNVSYIKLGKGDGTFVDGQQNPVAPMPGALTALLVDLNGDGKRDLVAYSSFFPRNQLKDDVLIGIGAGNGTFVPQAYQFNTFGYLQGTNPVAVDFNHDGKVDLAVPTAAVPGIGDGTFAPFSAIPGAFPPPAGNFAVSCQACFLAADLGRHGAPDLIYAANNAVSVARNTGGKPPLLAQLSLGATSVVGGGILAATVSLGGPAPAGGATVSISSSDAAAFFPGGATVTIPAGSGSATFTVTTTAVAAMTPVTISAAWKGSTIGTNLAVVPPFTLTSISFVPASMIGMFPFNAASGFVQFSGPVSDGVVINLTSSNPAAVSVPATVQVNPKFDNAGFQMNVLHVSADTPVTITASFQGVSKSATFTNLKGSDTVVITRAEYTVRSGQLRVEGTATDPTARLQVFNATSGLSLGFATLTSGKFAFQATAGGGVTSVAVQSDKGGLAIAPALQK